MVTAIEQQDADETITIVDPVEPDTEIAEPEAPVEGTPEESPEFVPSGNAPILTEGQAPAPVNTVSQQAPPVQSAPQVDQRSIDELRKYQQADVQREWKDRVGATA